MLSSRKKFAIGNFGLYVIGNAVAFVLGTVARQNIETAAESLGAHDELTGIAWYWRMIVDFIQESALPLIQGAAEFVSGPYGIGFAVGALVTAFWPNILKAGFAPIANLNLAVRRKKTGLVPLILGEKFHQYSYFENDALIRSASTYKGFSEFSPAAASVLVQSGLAEYASFFDDKRHMKYQKMTRGKTYRPYELYPTQDAEPPPLLPPKTEEETQR